MKQVFLLGAVAAAAFLAAVAPAAEIVVNEYWADDGFDDTAEFIELYGPAGTSLSGLSVIVVDGDTGGSTGSSNYRRVTLQFDLSGTMPADGFFVIGAGETPNIDLEFSVNTLQNGSQTIAIVGTDLIEFDPDDEDELTQASVDAITADSRTDAVATVDDDAGDHTYFGAPVLGPTTAGYPWDAAARIPNGVDTDTAGDWQTQDNFGPPAVELGDLNDALSSPGTLNGVPKVFGGATLMQAGATGRAVELEAIGGTPFSGDSYRYTILAPGLDPADGVLKDNGTAITTFPHTVEYNHTLTYDTPGAGYRGTPSVEFTVEDAEGLSSASSALHFFCVQDDQIVISEIMHMPKGTDDQHEYVEVYNYGASTVTLWGLGGNLFAETATANLSSQTIAPGEMKIIAPSNSPEEDEEFRCDWSLPEADVIRVDTATWQGISRSSSLVALYGLEGEDVVLLDAVWVLEGATEWSVTLFEQYRSLACEDLFGAGPTSETNDGGHDGLYAALWRLSGFGGDYYEAGVQESVVLGNFGSPGYVPVWFTSPVFEPCYYACCLPDGTCQETLESECEAACGTWYSGQTCDETTCTPLPTGACCTPYGDCLQISDCECALLAGATYGGDGSDCGTTTCPDPTTVVVNEIDYDNPSTDWFEYIELLGPPLFDLTGWTLELYNGGDGEPYETLDLTGLTIPADRFLLIGSEYVDSSDLLFDSASNNIQNGPDGIVLCDGSGVPVEVIAYEGSFDAVGGCADGMTLPDIGVEDITSSRRHLQKIPNGYDWTETLVGTPGVSNAEVGACCVQTACFELTPEECAPLGGAFQGPGTDCASDPCTDKGCLTIAEVKELGLEVGVLICDAVVSNTTDLVSSANSKNFHIQDATGGITVYGINQTIDDLGVSEGDVLAIYGTTDEFSGLLELVDDDLALAIDSSVAGSVPAPQAVTVADLQDGAPQAEQLESTLLTLECVIFEDAGGTFQGGTNYVVSDDGGLTTAEVRISTGDLDLVSTTIPSGYVNITGILGQYTGSGGAPDIGYQLQPRSLADITDCTTPPTGACCDGPVCTVETYLDCVSVVGGEFQGSGTTCDPNPCLVGACCLPLGGCKDEWTAGECDAVGGTYFEGEMCIDVDCPEPLGACCLPDGHCELLESEDCEFRCGTWNAGLDCDQVTCEADFAAACCLPYGQCVVTSECECLAADGNFNGDDPDCSATPCEGNPLVINEIRIDQPGGDVDEYFELHADSETSLYGLTYLVLGDGAGGSGVVEAVVDLYKTFVPSDGFFLAVEDTFTLAPLVEANLVLSSEDNGLNFENNDNVTHLLVFGFGGASGDDLDTDDDGTLDTAPWAEVIDCVALIEQLGGGDEVYCDDLVGPDGTFVPGHVWRNPDAGPWEIGIFDPADPGAVDTPGVSNLLVEPAMTAMESCLLHDGTEHCLALGTGAVEGDNVEPRLPGIKKLVVTLDGDAPASPVAHVFNSGGTEVAGVTAAVGPESYQVTLTIDPALANQDCHRVTIEGVEGEWYVVGLAGDTDRSGVVTSVDNSSIKPRYGAVTDATNFIYDIDASGIITSVDSSGVKPRFGDTYDACP